MRKFFLLPNGAFCYGGVNSAGSNVAGCGSAYIKFPISRIIWDSISYRRTYHLRNEEKLTDAQMLEAHTCSAAGTIEVIYCDTKEEAIKRCQESSDNVLGSYLKTWAGNVKNYGAVLFLAWANDEEYVAANPDSIEKELLSYNSEEIKVEVQKSQFFNKLHPERKPGINKGNLIFMITVTRIK